MTKLAVAEPVMGTVTVAAVSNAYGTSTPSVLRPSVRRYDTWIRLIVTWLLDVRPAALVMSFGARLSDNVPVSSKMTVHGLAVVHVPPLVTSVTTSDARVADGVPPDGAPRVANSELTTRMTGERVLRTTSPQDVADATSAAALRTRGTIRIV